MITIRPIAICWCWAFGPATAAAPRLRRRRPTARSCIAVPTLATRSVVTPCRRGGRGARTEINAKSGMHTGEVARAFTAEERAAAAAAADQAQVAADADAARERRDLAMVESYGTEADLRRAFGERSACWMRSSRPQPRRLQFAPEPVQPARPGQRPGNVRQAGSAGLLASGAHPARRGCRSSSASSPGSSAIAARWTVSWLMQWRAMTR